jgi:hypothetical protein
MAASAKANSQPFYTQVTNVKEEFTSAAGVPSSVDLPLVTIPAGTVLFRGLRIPNPANGEDVRHFYRDYLGDPEGPQYVCLSPIHNVYFYPFPYVAFGAQTVGATFTMMQMVVLVHPVTVVCAMSPSDFVRGRGLRDDGTAPWQRCSNFVGSGIDCHTRTGAEQRALSYDNCLRPEYQARSGTRGWMAIADRDSLNPVVVVEGRKRAVVAKDASMSQAIRKLAAQMPLEAAKTLASTYKDAQGHAGFPEMALYPYRKHKGLGVIKRACPSNDMAMRIIEKEALDDNLNYLPIAAFTKNGVIDMVGGEFSYSVLQPTENAFVAEGSQDMINKNVFAFLDKVQKEGLVLPYYGACKMKQDTRTGFYVLDKIVPGGLRLGPSSQGQKQAVLYRSILLPLDTEPAQRFAMKYTLVMRNFFPEQFLKDYEIGKGSFVKQAMVFNRFAFLKALFDELGITMPDAVRDGLRMGAALYQRVSGKPSASAASKAPAPVPAPVAVAEAEPAYATVTPQGTPPSGVSPGTPPGTPPSGVQPKGGKRRTKRKTTLRRKTRRIATQTGGSAIYGKHLASLFTRVWKVHARR